MNLVFNFILILPLFLTFSGETDQKHKHNLCEELNKFIGLGHYITLL